MAWHGFVFVCIVLQFIVFLDCVHVGVYVCLFDFVCLYEDVYVCKYVSI